MTIAEQIMLGNQQQAKNWSVLSESLATLGQQVGQTLAMRQYQKEAQAALPALQQSYTGAMDKIQAGNISEGYRDMLTAQLQYGTTQNPYIARMNAMAGDVFNNAMNVELKRFQAEKQYGPRGTTPSGASPVNVSEFFPGVFGSTGADEGMDAGANVAQTGMGATQGTPAQQAMQRQADAEYGTYEDADKAATQEMLAMEASPEQQQAVANARSVLDAPVENRLAQAESFTVPVSNVNKEKYEVIPVRGLDKFIPNATGFGVPKKEWEESRATMGAGGAMGLTSTKVEPLGRKNFYKDGNFEEGTGGTKQNVETSIKIMNGRDMSKYFQQFGNDIYKMGASVSETAVGKDTKYSILLPNQEKPTQITKSQYLAVQVLSGLAPGAAENANDTPVIVDQGKLTQEQAIEKAIQKLGPQASDDQIANEVRKMLGQ